MTPVFSKPFSPATWVTPLASFTGTKVSGLGMEAEPNLACRAFFRRSSMTCPKCAGLLVPAPSPLHLLSDYFIDTYDLQDKRSAAVKCWNCGYYADAVILMNKANQVNAQRLVAQAEGWASTHSYNTNTKELQHHGSSEIARITVFSQNEKGSNDARSR